MSWRHSVIQCLTICVRADTDLLSDHLWVQSQNFFGQRVTNTFANNGDFFVNIGPQQQKGLEKFLKPKLEIRKELREVRRQLDADIEALGGRLKVVNIALVPLLLTLSTLGFLGWRADRKHAKEQSL
jgi:ABC-type uncharacterized transport system involved in gliding motility auxiliary subunit